jgi:hypothetical protein
VVFAESEAGKKKGSYMGTSLRSREGRRKKGKK